MSVILESGYWCCSVCGFKGLSRRVVEAHIAEKHRVGKKEGGKERLKIWILGFLNPSIEKR